MKLSHEAKEQGRAIARGIAEENAQKERNMAKAEKRHNTMLANAAEQLLSGNMGVQRVAPAKIIHK